jgi:elongation factor G
MKPAPILMNVAMEPRFKADQDRVIAALRELEAADASFQARTDEESGQIIIGGTREDQLAGKVEALQREYGLDLNIGAPQVAYLETISRRGEVDFVLKQLGGRRAFARVKLAVAPRDRGEGNVFVSVVQSQALPEAYRRAIGRGSDLVLGSGILAGFPVTDVAIRLLDWAHHDQDSSEAAFEEAARLALRQALQKGMSVLLEPIMTLEVRVPDDVVEAVLADLRNRRAIVQSRETDGSAVLVGAQAPLAMLFGYANSLRAMSEGRGTHTMCFSHYEAVPSFTGDGPYPTAMALRMPAVLALGDSA